MMFLVRLTSVVIIICVFASLATGVSDNWGNGYRVVYSRDLLMQLRQVPPADYSYPNTIYHDDDVARSEDADSSDLPRHKRRRAGVRVRTRRRGMRPPVPTLMFGNVRSVRNKVDELEACCRFNSEFRDSAVICLTETWLEQRDADSTVQIDHFNLFRGDRKGTQKQHGGGVGIYVNERWCKNVSVKNIYCDDNVEILTVCCRPYYLPREFACVYLTVAYVPPSGDHLLAADKLSDSVSSMEDRCPTAVHILVGDFNGCDVSELLPNFHQFVKCTTRGDRTLDLLYCNIKDAYRVVKRSPLGNSDHNMLFCMPAYKQKLKSGQCNTITFKEWSDESIEMLKACFDCTMWDVLFESSCDLEYNVNVCTSYIQFCVDTVIPVKTVKTFPNNKPWVTKEVKSVLKRKNAALSNRDGSLKVVQKELNTVITAAKHTYKEKVERLFKSNQTKDAWKGLKQLSGYVQKSCIPEPVDMNKFVNDLNVFYTRFDDKDFSKECRDVLEMVKTKKDDKIVLSDEVVLKALNRAKIGKACGPDRMCGKVVKLCKSELAVPMKTLFQASLDECCVPVLWKTSEIAPVPKVKVPVEENDLRPVALTCIVMKCLESIVRNLVRDSVKEFCDLLQFAYVEGRCVDDAVTTLLHTVLTHLDKSKTYSRLLYIDFSSAFNTMQPHILLTKLYNMNVNSNLILWIYSFLTNRPQYVKLRNSTSNTLVTNTGAPQGCVFYLLCCSLCIQTTVEVLRMVVM